jgi:hypothetical protein
MPNGWWIMGRTATSEATALLRTFFCPILLLLVLSPAIVDAQLLPLGQGNEWTYDYVLGEERSADALRLSIQGTVALGAATADTVAAVGSVWAGLSQSPGTEYAKLVVDGLLGVFPLRPVDTLLVRVDGTGNVLIRGFSFASGGSVVKAEEQLWFSGADSAPPLYTVEAGLASDPYAQMQYTVRLRWQLDDPATGWETASWQSESEFGMEPGYEQFLPLVPLHARRIQERWVPGALQVLGFFGGLRGVADAAFGFFVIPGLGMTYIPLWSDQSELQGRHYELSRAAIDGREIPVDTPTATVPHTWAQIKHRRSR